MLDEAEIRKEIARLEYEESSYPNYAKLANLYTIQARMNESSQHKILLSSYSGAVEPQNRAVHVVGEYGDSDFLQAIYGKDPARVWPVLDELMDTLSIVNKKVYDSVMQKIKKS